MVFALCLLGRSSPSSVSISNPQNHHGGHWPALGASLANLFILLKMEVLLLLVGLVFVLEALSVIIQVAYFKLTKGKRVFLMAPLHHHFELKGYSEIEIDAGFWLLALISGAIGLLLGLHAFV